MLSDNMPVQLGSSAQNSNVIMPTSDVGFHSLPSWFDILFIPMIVDANHHDTSARTTNFGPIACLLFFDIWQKSGESMADQQIAVLVDGDNVSPKHATRILEEAAKLGQVNVTRVYIAADKPSEWLTKPGFRLMCAGAGKNASDLLLSIDAMELALEKGIKRFVIASSDGDFTHLAFRLRERGLDVLGLGEIKAPDNFRLACTKFILLEPIEKKPVTPNTAKVPNDMTLDQKIHSVISNNSKNGQGVAIALLAVKMRTIHNTLTSDFSEKNWRGYLKNRPTLYQLDPSGPNAKVRFIPEGFKCPQKSGPLSGAANNVVRL